MAELSKLRQQISASDSKVRLDAVGKLASIGEDKALDILLPLLTNENAAIRNAVALSLRKIGDNRAVKPLIKAINNPKNKHNRGTLLYALEKLNCSKLFLPMVELALYGNYEVQCHALNILRKQDFATSKKEIAIANKMINKYLGLKEKVQDCDLLVNELRKYVSKIERKLIRLKTLSKP